MYKIKLFALGFLILISSSAISQNAKKHLKTGKELFKVGKYEDAINQYSKAIELDPRLLKAFYGRAEAYLKINKKEKAAKDYEYITVLSPKKKDVAAYSGKLYFELKKYEKAVILLNKATKILKKDIDSYKYKVLSLIELEKFKTALTECNALVDLEESAENFYHRGWIHQNLKNYAAAEKDYLESITIMNKYLRAYVQLAVVRLYLEKLDPALEAANNAVKINGKSKNAYLVRSLIYKKKLDYPSAVRD